MSSLQKIMGKSVRILTTLLMATVIFGLAGCSSPAGSDPTYYTVTFDTQGGTPAEVKVSVVNDGTVAAPTPTKANYDLEGWYREAAYTHKWNFASDTVTANITLYAKWSPAADFVAVTNITNVPDEGTVGTLVSLAGATVVPATATYTDISWRVTTAGAGLALGVINGNSFTPTAAGQVKLTANILHGNEDGGIYSQEFTIDISPAFVPVSGIEGLPATRNAVTGAPLVLTGGISVVPAAATNQDIVWSVASAGNTGLTNEDVENGGFTPEHAGTVTLTATIFNGIAQGSNYTQHITLTIIKPVLSINVPAEGTKDYEIDLGEATVEPVDATYTAIEWTIQNAGTTGVTGIVDGKFTPTGTGDLVLIATIADGSAIGTPFTHDYTITIYGSGEFTPEFGFGEDTSILLRGSAAGQEQLSKDAVIEIAKDSVYYVSLITGDGGSYSNVVWYLNGTKQNISGSGSMIHLDTSAARTIKLSVIGTRNALVEGSGTYTFKIVESE